MSEITCKGYNTWVVFGDFCTASMLALSQPMYKDAEREKEYKRIEEKYGKTDMEKIAEMLACTTIALTDQPRDFLGEIFMENELGNHYAGQFFTPYNLSKMIAQMVGVGGPDFCEPCCGSGGMIIAYCEVCREQKKPLPIVEAWDIAHICWKMTYIQLSVLGIPAKVVNGDTLAMKEYVSLLTPAYVLNAMEKKVIERTKGYDELVRQNEANGNK